MFNINPTGFIFVFLTICILTFLACGGSENGFDEYIEEVYEEEVLEEEVVEFIHQKDFLDTIWLFTFEIDGTTFNRVYSFIGESGTTVIGSDTEREPVALVKDEANGRFVLVDVMDQNFELVFIFDSFVEGCVSFHRGGVFTECVPFVAEELEYFEEI